MCTLLDTNIIVDLFLARPAFVRNAEALWEAKSIFSPVEFLKQLSTQ